MTPRTQAELVERAQPLRAARRPRECTGGKPCWVEDPYAAINGSNGGSVPRCTTCNGRIGQPPPSRDEYFAAGLP